MSVLQLPGHLTRGSPFYVCEGQTSVGPSSSVSEGKEPAAGAQGERLHHHSLGLCCCCGFISFLNDLLFFIMYTEGVLCALVPLEAGGEGFPWNWSERSCGCWELNSGPLQKQYTILTTEPSLQPLLFLR